MPIKPVYPLPPPLDPVSGIIDFVATILSLFGFGRVDLSALTAAVNSTYANLVVTSFFLYNSLLDIFGFVRKVLGTLLAGLSHIITDILHGHLKKVLQDIQDLMHALRDLFAPLLLWLRKLQAAQRSAQFQALKRFLNMIQRVRQILVVFRLLHFKWASRLDTWLKGIEGKVITRELDIARKTNEVIAWLNVLVDPFALLRGVPVWGAIGRDMRGIIGAANAAGLSKVFPQLRTTTGPHTPSVPWALFWQQPATQSAGAGDAYGQFQSSVRDVRDILNRELST